jgi:hypothetical protein
MWLLWFSLLLQMIGLTRANVDFRFEKGKEGGALTRQSRDGAKSAYEMRWL